jgi:hypothetical protein
VIAHKTNEVKKVQIDRGPLNVLVENHLPDGSRFLIDPKNETVYALNATAGAAWDACSAPTTLRDVTKEMQRSFGPDVTEEIAEKAVIELQKRNLVTASVRVPQPAPCAVASVRAPQPTRRAVLTTLGKVALPLVVAMTLTEQRAHAVVAISGRPRTPQPEPAISKTPHCGPTDAKFGLC